MKFNAFPIAWMEEYTKEPRGHNLWALTPVIHHRVRGDELTIHVLPVYYRTASEGKDFAWFAPLNFRTRDDAARSFDFVAFPFWWNQRRAGWEVRHFWPVYGRSLTGPEGSRTARHHVLYPLGGWTREPGGRISEVHAHPLFHWRDDGLTALGLDPLAALFSASGGWSRVRVGHLFDGSLSAYRRERDGAISYDGLLALGDAQYQILSLFTRRSEGGKTSTRLVFVLPDPDSHLPFAGLFARKAEGETSATHVLPLWMDLLSAFRHSRSPAGARADLLSLGWGDDRIGLGTLSRGNDGTITGASLVPFAFYHRDGEETRWAAGGLPPILSLVSGKSRGREGHAWTGVVRVLPAFEDLFSAFRRSASAEGSRADLLSLGWEDDRIGLGTLRRDTDGKVTAARLFPFGDYEKKGGASSRWSALGLDPILAGVSRERNGDDSTLRAGRVLGDVFAVYRREREGGVRRDHLLRIGESADLEANPLSLFTLERSGTGTWTELQLLPALRYIRGDASSRWWFLGAPPIASGLSFETDLSRLRVASVLGEGEGSFSLFQRSRRGGIDFDGVLNWGGPGEVITSLAYRKKTADEMAVRVFQPLGELASLYAGTWNWTAKSRHGIGNALGLSLFETASEETDAGEGAGAGRGARRSHTILLGAGAAPWLAAGSYRRDGDDVGRHLLPFYVGRTTEGLSWDLLLPVGFRRKVPDLSYWFTPAAGYLRRGETDRTYFLAPPLFFYERDPADNMRGLGLLWPLGAWGYKSRGTGADMEWDFALHPLGWYKVTKNTTGAYWAPVFVSLTDADSSLFFSIPYGRVVQDHGQYTKSFWLLNALIRTEDKREALRRTDVLYPLAKFERKGEDVASDRLFPFYFRSREGKDERIWGTLYHYRRDAASSKGILYPIAGRMTRLDEKGDVAASRWSVLPLLDARFLGDEPFEGSQTSVLFPLAHFEATKERGTGWVFPVFGSKRTPEGREWTVYPFFGTRTTLAGDGSVRGSRWSFLPALDFRADDFEGSQVSALYPLVHFEGTADRASGRAFPVFWRSRTPEAKSWTVYPLFGWRRARSADGGTRGRRVTVLPALDFRGSDFEGSQVSILYPFASFEDAEARHVHWLGPFWVHRKDGDGERTWGTLYHSRFAAQEGRRLLYPILGWRRTGTAGANTTGTNWSVFPLLDPNHLTDRPIDDRRVSFFWPLASLGRRGAETSSWAFPVYWNFDSERATHWHLWPFYGYDREGDFERGAVLYPFFFKGKNRDGSRREWGAFYPIAGSMTKAGRTACWVLPSLWYWEGESHKSWIGWPILGRAASGGETRWSILPFLDWRFLGDRPVEGTGASLLYPLAGAEAGGGEARTWFLPPVFWRRREADGGLHWYLFYPFTNYRSKPDGTRVFTVLEYLYRKERLPGQPHEVHVLQALYRSRESADGTTFESSVPILYRYRREADKKTLYLLQLIPIGL